MGSLAWKILGTVSALVAAAIADRGLNLAWHGVTGTKPPTIPEDPETSWREALAWAAVSGAVLGLARLVATRQAAAYYRRSTGEMPKALRR
jgi:hypothetical protein